MPYPKESSPKIRVAVCCPTADAVGVIVTEQVSPYESVWNAQVFDEITNASVASDSVAVPKVDGSVPKTPTVTCSGVPASPTGCAPNCNRYSWLSTDL